MDVDQDNIESVEEVELGERKTDSQKTDGLEIFGLSQDLHDEEKVISKVEMKDWTDVQMEEGRNEQMNERTNE